MPTPAPSQIDAHRRELRRVVTSAPGSSSAEQLAAEIVAQAGSIADAVRRGGRVLVVGEDAARPAADHFAVECNHPVTAGRRAIAALVVDPPAIARWRRPHDVVVGFGDVRDADVRLPWHGPSGLQRTTRHHHLAWEAIHVLLEDAELAGDTAFLGGYDGSLVDALAASTAEKVSASDELCAAAVVAHADQIVVAVEALGAAGAVFTAGNGGSATDAGFLAATLGEHLPATCLVDDVALVTALSNDVGYDAVLARAILAVGQPGDVLVTLSTSGSSANVLAAHDAARRFGIVTIALAGPVLPTADGAADIMFNADSSSIHRVQEMHAALLDALVVGVGAGR